MQGCTPNLPIPQRNFKFLPPFLCFNHHNESTLKWRSRKQPSCQNPLARSNRVTVSLSAMLCLSSLATQLPQLRPRFSGEVSPSHSTVTRGGRRHLSILSFANFFFFSCILFFNVFLPISHTLPLFLPFSLFPFRALTEILNDGATKDRVKSEMGKNIGKERGSVIERNRWMRACYSVQIAFHFIRCQNEIETV